MSAKPVTLLELARAAAAESAGAAVRMLGGHRISPQCRGVTWESLPAGRERGTCPAGWVHLGDARAKLGVEVTRRVAAMNDSSVVLHLRAETPGDGWMNAIRVAVRAAWDELGGEAAERELLSNQRVFDLAGTRVTLTDEGARLSPASGP